MIGKDVQGVVVREFATFCHYIQCLCCSFVVHCFSMFFLQPQTTSRGTCWFSLGISSLVTRPQVGERFTSLMLKHPEITMVHLFD